MFALNQGEVCTCPSRALVQRSLYPDFVHDAVLRVEQIKQGNPVLRRQRARLKRAGEFHQSGGCCDGSAPMCYPDGDFLLGDADIHLGDLDVGLEQPVPVWISRPQFEYWSHTHLTLDVVEGRGAGFSLEAPYGVRFLIRSRLLTDDEAVALSM